MTYPNNQGNPAGGIPVYLSEGAPASAPYQPTPLGYQQLPLTSGAQGLTVPTGATYAVISLEGANARWRDDGVVPTETVGMLLYAAAPPLTFPGEISAAKFINATSTAGTLNVSYYK